MKNKKKRNCIRCPHDVVFLRLRLLYSLFAQAKNKKRELLIAQTEETKNFHDVMIPLHRIAFL
jgi:hypothetical protein